MEQKKVYLSIVPHLIKPLMLESFIYYEIWQNPDKYENEMKLNNRSCYKSSDKHFQNVCEHIMIRYIQNWRWKLYFSHQSLLSYYIK